VREDGCTSCDCKVCFLGGGFLHVLLKDSWVFDFTDETEILDETSLSTFQQLNVQHFYENLLVARKLCPDIGNVAAIR
jgi:hypothetical protein